jgi:hypothetical protein
MNLKIGSLLGINTMVILRKQEMVNSNLSDFKPPKFGLGENFCIRSGILAEDAKLGVPLKFKSIPPKGYFLSSNEDIDATGVIFSFFKIGHKIFIQTKQLGNPEPLLFLVEIKYSKDFTFKKYLK